jgi:hypothetical protein
VQVGENVKRTIGFGQDSSTTNDMIHSLRKILKDQDAVEKLFGKPENNQPYQKLDNEPTTPSVKILPRTTLLATLIVTAVLLLYYLGPVKQAETPTGLIAIKPPDKIDNQEVITPEENQPIDEIPTLKQQPSSETKPTQMREEASPLTVIGQYPDDIKDAITNSITGQFDPDATTTHKQNTLPLITSELSEETKGKQLSKTNLFVLLQAASNTGAADGEGRLGSQTSTGNEPWIHRYPSMNSTTQDDQDEAEAKRQLVHQRFLDAIKRASEKRSQPEGF